MRIHALVAMTGLLSTGIGSAAAQQLPDVPQVLALQDAIDLAADFSPIYRQTINDRAAAAWGVRNAYAAFLPNFSANGSVSYRGAGSQQFLTTNFEQPSATIGSSYSLNLNWRLDGQTLMQPGVQKAQLEATSAQIDAARMTVRNSVVQQYLAVLEAQAQVELQEQQVTRNEENLRLAQARFEVGQATMLDVRQAEVARGQSEVALLRANQTVTVEKLRLFQQMGVPAPEDPSVVLLSDSFPIVEPDFELGMLINAAMMDNPDVISFRAQTRSMERNERSVKSQWLPSASFSASWSGFTQQFTNSDFLVDRAAAQSAGAFASCQETNTIRASAGLTANDCTGFSFTPDAEASIRAQNSVFPFDFSQQPFAARVSISLPIFDQFSRNLQISQAAARADDAREQTRARELQVRTDVSNLHFGLIAAYRAIQIQENNQESAQEQLRLARERYRVGAGTFFELLDAQVVAQQAAADYITAIYSYHRALADLEAAVGSPLR